MPGLGMKDDQMMPPAAPAPAGMQPDPSAMSGQPAGLGARGAAPGGLDNSGDQVTPEEQALYDKFVSMALIALYDQKTIDQSAQMIASADDPTIAVAEVASSVALRVLADAQDNGVELTGDVLLHGGKEIVEAAIEVAEKVSGVDFDDQMMEASFFAAADMFKAEAEKMGMYGDDAKAEDIQAIEQMKASGQLEQMIGQMQGGKTGAAKAPDAPAPRDEGMM
jgi:hypothetical protein